MPWVPALIFVICASFAAVSTFAQTAAATYPNKPVRLVHGFPAGGPADIFSRTIAQKLTEVMGQQVIVDSRPGAGGIIATEHVAKAPADGYTAYLASSAVLALYANLYDKLPYDLNRDFVPVTLAVAVPELLVVHPSLPTKTAKEFVALAKANPKQLMYGSTGKRSPALPDVPTTAEAGYPSVNADNWYGIIVAAATPKDIVSKLHASLVSALQAPETKQRMESQGANAMSSSPQELAAYMRNETIKWGKIIKAAGIKLDAQ